MNDDTISRQMAIDACHNLDDGKDAYAYGFVIEERLQKLPSAQPERKKGRWIIRNNPGTGWYRVTCSECSEDVTSTIPMIGFFPNAKPLWDYCPWCGARMKGEENE